MLRKIIRPVSENYNIQIPKEYINRDVEILVLPFLSEENLKITKDKLKKTFNPEEFYNASNSSKSEIDNDLENSKNEWANHV